MDWKLLYDDREMQIRIASLFLAVTAAASGQTLGQITGQVSDASGALVAGAAVSATNAATGGNRTTTSNEAGIYSLCSPASTA